MFISCTTTDLSCQIIKAFKNEDDELVVERTDFPRETIHIIHPKELAGHWVITTPLKTHIPLPYGPQGLIYTPVTTDDEN